MPYFKWRAIDLEGNIYKGKDFARSATQIDNALFSHKVALIKIRQTNSNIFLEKISNKQKLDFFRMLSILLSSGINLAQALEIILQKQKSGRFKLIIQDIFDAVCQGISLGHALEFHNDIFDELTVALIKSGQESGKFSECLNMIVESSQERQNFLQNLRSALLVPVITFVFFIIILLLLFIFVIPRFAHTFASLGNQLPWSTKLVLSISNFLTSFKILYIGIILFILFLALNRLLKINKFKLFKDRLILNTPVLGQIIFQFNLANFLRTGVHLIDALNISKQAVSNIILKDKIKNIIKLVQQGKTLGQSFKQVGFDDPELLALISVGQESSALSYTVLKSSHIYQDQFYLKIKFLITLVQPLLLIVIGLFIAMLIFAVYVPIFTVSSIVQ